MLFIYLIGLVSIVTIVTCEPELCKWIILAWAINFIIVFTRYMIVTRELKRKKKEVDRIMQLNKSTADIIYNHANNATKSENN